MGQLTVKTTPETVWSCSKPSFRQAWYDKAWEPGIIRSMYYYRLSTPTKRYRSFIHS